MKPKDELEIDRKLKEERDCSNYLYAPMIIKTIVFSFIGLICIAFIGFLTKLIW